MTIEQRAVSPQEVQGTLKALQDAGISSDNLAPMVNILKEVEAMIVNREGMHNQVETLLRSGVTTEAVMIAMNVPQEVAAA